MPAIQAMRSDALAMRAKEDVQEKIPSFFNSVNKALGQNIVQGQDSAQAVAEARFSAANQLAATLRQKIDGEGSLAELVAGAGMDLINSSISLLLAILKKTTTIDLLNTASAISSFLSEREALQLQWDAAAASFAQWTVQAGYTGHDDGTFFPPPTPVGGPAPIVPVTKNQVVSQWLRATGPAVLPTTADGTPNLFSLTFVGQGLTQPGGLTPYEYDDPNLAEQLYPTGQPSPRRVSVEFDRSGDGLFGFIGTDGRDHRGNIVLPIPAPPDEPTYTNPTVPGGVGQGDTSSQLFVGAPGEYWLRYDYVMPVTQGATAYFEDVQQVTVSGIRSGVDYDPGTGTVNGNSSPNNSDTRTSQFDPDRRFTTSITSDSGTTLNVSNSTGFYAGDVIEIPLSGGGFDYKTIKAVSPGSFTLDAELAGTPTGSLTTIYPQNPAGFDGAIYNDDRGTPLDPADDVIRTNPRPESYPDIPRFFRANNANIVYGAPYPPGPDNENQIRVSAIKPVTEKYALGGRGATTYRDALTPRWTDRNYYWRTPAPPIGGRTMADYLTPPPPGAKRDYESYYQWGSVGSISRVGRY